MQQVPRERLVAGMVLARDVENYQGNRILTKGAVLTDSLIALLRHWKVAEVFVEPEQPKAEEKPAQPAAAPDHALDVEKKRLNEIFDGSLVNGWMNELRNETEKRLGVHRFWKSGR